MFYYNVKLLLIESDFNSYCKSVKCKNYSKNEEFFLIFLLVKQKNFGPFLYIHIYVIIYNI